MKKKLPTPRKLPSGSWRCQVMVDGKRVSVVAPTPGEAQAKAVAIQSGLIKETKTARKGGLTLGEAMDRYIESKDSVLSPSTVAGYKRIRKTDFPDLIDLQLEELTQEKVQRSINALAKKKSPKSVRNAHGLLSATIRAYRPEMALITTLPQKKRTEIQIPTEEEAKKLVKAAKGAPIELPLLLGMWLGLRISEIIGLTWDSVQGSTLHVKEAIVDGEDGPTVKGTKTYNSDRYLEMPPRIAELIEQQPKTEKHIVPMSRRAIYTRFTRLCQNAGVPHYRFHDLRHYYASVMLALNVPDKYAMERMGHATNNMLKTVYQHTMQAQRQKAAKKINGYFSKWAG